MSEEKTISSKVIFQGRAVTLRVDNVLADGRETTREIVEHADCIAVVAVDDRGNLLLVKQYRKAPEKVLLEIPAGGIDPGEDPETATRREMGEETGYLPQKLHKLGGFYLSPGFSTEYLHLYLATELTPGRLFAEDTEEIELVRLPLEKVLDMAGSGEIEDGKTLAGLFQYLEYLKLHPRKV